MQRPVAEVVEDFADVLWVVRDMDCTIALAESLVYGKYRPRWV